jgi:hypothetical protein
LQKETQQPKKSKEYIQKQFNKYAWLVNFDRYIETRKVKEISYTQKKNKDAF